MLKPKTDEWSGKCLLWWQNKARQGRHLEHFYTNTMKRLSGLKLLEEREGAGTPANKGDRVLFNMRLFLNKGDEVPLNETQATHLPKEMIRAVDGVILIDRTIVLGRRETMAGVEHALMGMKSRRLSESAHQPALGLSR